MRLPNPGVDTGSYAQELINEVVAAITPAAGQVMVGGPNGVTGVPAFNVRAFGAKGDGITDDTAAIQETVDAAAAAGGGEVFVPPGVYRLTSWVILRSHIRLFGAGAGKSILFNDKSNPVIDKRACLLVGNHHPDFMATQTSYALNTIAGGDPSVTATTAGDAANVAVGQLVIVGSNTLIGGVPRHAQLNKITGISGGTINLTDPIEVDISDGRLWTITGTDGGTGAAIAAVEDVAVERLGFKGRSAIATKGAMFGATFRDLAMLDVAIIFATNLMTHVLIENITGQYCNRLFDFAQNSYDVTVRNVRTRFIPPAGLQAGETMETPVLLEQQPYRVILDQVTCRVDAGFTTNAEIMQVKGSKILLRNCDVRHGGTGGSYAIQVPECSYTGYGFDDIVFENCRLAAPGKARIVQVGNGVVGPTNPRNVRLMGGELRESVTSEAIKFQTGQGLVCSMTNRTGKNINVSSTAAYPLLAGYRMTN
jgi:hypothetical protein